MTVPASQPLWTPMPLIRVTGEFFADKGIESARHDDDRRLEPGVGCSRLQPSLAADAPLHHHKHDP